MNTAKKEQPSNVLLVTVDPDFGERNKRHNHMHLVLMAAQGGKLFREDALTYLEVLAAEGHTMATRMLAACYDFLDDGRVDHEGRPVCLLVKVPSQARVTALPVGSR